MSVSSNQLIALPDDISQLRALTGLCLAVHDGPVPGRVQEARCLA